MSRSAVGAAPATNLVRGPSRRVGIKSAGKDGGMRKRKTYIVVAVLLVAIVGMMGLAIGCGSSDDGGGSASASPTGGAISGSAMERATAILGHEPTGLALDIVTKGVVGVVGDDDFALGDDVQG